MPKPAEPSLWTEVRKAFETRAAARQARPSSDPWNAFASQTFVVSAAVGASPQLDSTKTRRGLVLSGNNGLGICCARSAAFDLRDRLDDLGLPSGALLSGGKGIHVIVPLRPKAEWEAVKLFSRTVSVMLSDAEPERFIATMSKARRKGLIFIDWLRNERGSTAIAPYSLRARPGAKVAVPVTWEELAAIGSAGEFDIVAVLGRLEMPCPLQDVARRAVVLDGKVLKRLEKQLAG